MKQYSYEDLNQMPVRAIKNILAKELQGHYEGFLPRASNDIQKEMCHRFYREMSIQLDECQTYKDLEAYLRDSGYGMSLTEWINSL